MVKDIKTFGIFGFFITKNRRVSLDQHNFCMIGVAVKQSTNQKSSMLKLSKTVHSFAVAFTIQKLLRFDS